MNTANPLWLASAPLVLASKSASRRALLTAAAIPFEAIDVEIDERALEDEARAGGASPAEVALRLARAKALAGSEAAPGRLVLGADQTLALGTEPFHKPIDRAAAKAQLTRLAGQIHALLSAIALAQNGAILFETVEAAHLAMRPMDETVLDAYLDAAGPVVLTSVGAYQLEGVGIHLFERVEGEHSVILGLPLLPLLAFLRNRGALK